MQPLIRARPTRPHPCGANTLRGLSNPPYRAASGAPLRGPSAALVGGPPIPGGLGRGSCGAWAALRGRAVDDGFAGLGLVGAVARHLLEVFRVHHPVEFVVCLCFRGLGAAEFILRLVAVLLQLVELHQGVEDQQGCEEEHQHQQDDAREHNQAGDAVLAALHQLLPLVQRAACGIGERERHGGRGVIVLRRARTCRGAPAGGCACGSACPWRMRARGRCWSRTRPCRACPPGACRAWQA